MFTGIVEDVGRIISVKKEKENLLFEVTSKITPQLSVDQSVSHNGVCLTVTSLQENSYSVTAVKETIERSTLGLLKTQSPVNLERAIGFNQRLDGHTVQGHVDQTAECLSVKDEGGSWCFTFSLDSQHAHLVVDKGSIAIDGVSLTVIDPTENSFDVAIIPYTLQHTTFRNLKKGNRVNIEFDILGKYISRFLMLRELPENKLHRRD